MDLQIFGKMKKPIKDTPSEKKKELQTIKIKDSKRFSQARIANDMSVTTFNRLSRSYFTKFLEETYNDGKEYCVKEFYTLIDAIEILYPKYDLEEILEVWFYKCNIFLNSYYDIDYVVHYDCFRSFKNFRSFNILRKRYLREKDSSHIDYYKKRQIDSVKKQIYRLLFEQYNFDFLKNAFKISIG